MMSKESDSSMLIAYLKKVIENEDSTQEHPEFIENEFLDDFDNYVFPTDLVASEPNYAVGTNEVVMAFSGNNRCLDGVNTYDYRNSGFGI